MNNQLKSKINWKYFFPILVILALISIALFRFDNETDKNTYVVSGYINDLEYGFDQQKSWAVFYLQNEKYYYQFYDKANAKSDYEVFQFLQREKKHITLTCTSEKDWLRMFFQFADATRVISIEDSEKVYFDIKLHNDQEFFYRLECLILAFLVFCVTVLWWLFFEIPVLPNRKNGKFTHHSQKRS